MAPTDLTTTPQLTTPTLLNTPYQSSSSISSAPRPLPRQAEVVPMAITQPNPIFVSIPQISFNSPTQPNFIQPTNYVVNSNCAYVPNSYLSNGVCICIIGYRNISGNCQQNQLYSTSDSIPKDITDTILGGYSTTNSFSLPSPNFVPPTPPINYSPPFSGNSNPSLPLPSFTTPTNSSYSPNFGSNIPSTPPPNSPPYYGPPSQTPLPISPQPIVPTVKVCKNN